MGGGSEYRDDALAGDAPRYSSQAARVALPPLSNSFISLVKDTSLAATIQCRNCSARPS
jgi:hypothetical protein